MSNSKLRFSRWCGVIAFSAAVMMAGCPEICDCVNPPEPCDPDTSVVPPYWEHICDALEPEECGEASLVLSSKKLGIRFEPELSEAAQAAIVAGVAILRPFDERELAPMEGFLTEGIQQILIPTCDCTTQAQVIGAIAQLNATEGVLFVSQLFTFNDIDTLLILDDVRVYFDIEAPVEEIDALNDHFGVGILGTMDFPSLGYRRYRLRPTSTWPLDTLALAHVYHQQAIVVRASAGLTELSGAWD